MASDGCLLFVYKTLMFLQVSLVMWSKYSWLQGSTSVGISLRSHLPLPKIAYNPKLDQQVQWTSSRSSVEPARVKKTVFIRWTWIWEHLSLELPEVIKQNNSIQKIAEKDWAIMRGFEAVDLAVSEAKAGPGYFISMTNRFFPLYMDSYCLVSKALWLRVLMRRTRVKSWGSCI